MEELAGEYIAYARQLSVNNCFNKAIDLYLMAFEKCPEMKISHEEEFRAVLLRGNEILASGNKFDAIFINFGRAQDVFPDNKYLLNDMGKYLYKFAFYLEAWWHFQKAFNLDTSYVNPEKNLNSVKNLLVERWHFRMLNDKIRNEAYHDAIRKTLQQTLKLRVLDIGTGTGLLAMYATLYKPTAVTACDGSETMAELAASIIKENGMSEIAVIPRMSTTLNIPDNEDKFSLVVTEMFDAGLLGEHILQTLAHAWENLIHNEGHIIPNKAEFFVAAAKCDLLHIKYQLCTSVKTLLNIPTLNVHVHTNNETYDCEDVHLFKDIKYMSEPKSILKVNFNNYLDIQDKLTASEPYNIEFNATETGEINIYIGWFNLYLIDSITITTDARSEMRASAWQQAVFFDNPPIMVQEKQAVKTKFLIDGGKLTMLHANNTHIWRISPEAIRFLNDSEYLKVITGSIGMACVYLGQMAEMSQISIVDLCPFPIFGFQLLKRGAISLVCYAKTDSDKQFFEKVFEANNIPLTKITILVGDLWSQEVFKDEKYHAIFVNILEMCGEIDLRQKEIAQHLRNNNLVQGGLFMPANIRMFAQLVSSPWLGINNRVYDENVNNFKVAKYINKYEVSQNFCIDLTQLEYAPITDAIPMGICSNEMRSQVVNAPIIKDGYASAILCWYSIELMDDFDEISTKRSTSFIDGIVFLTCPEVPMASGALANVLLCVDVDGSFKLAIDP